MTEEENSRPEWLTEEYIGKIFNDFVKKERDEKELIEWDCEIVGFVKKFENISTNLFKVKVTNKKNRKEVYNAFVKTLCHSATNHFQVSLDFQKLMFLREGTLYRNYLSEISKILKRIEGNTMKFPKLYHFDVDPLVIIIEDMSSKGFAPYSKNCTIEEYEEVFKYLARYHAVSYYVHHELKMDLSKYNNLIINAEHIPIMEMGFQMFNDVIATWENCKELAKKMQEFKPYYVDNILKLLKANTNDGFNVLSHGDFHKLNLLARNDDNDCILIDYQLSAWRSPSYDIFSIFNNFCNPEVFLNSKDILIKAYHTEFKQILRKLNFSYRIPTLLDVHQEVLRYGLLNLGFWSIYKPLTILYDFPSEDRKDFVKAFGIAYDILHKQKLYKLFPQFLDLGYLECVD